MKREVVTQQATKMETALRQGGSAVKLWDDYTIRVWALQSIGDLYPLDRAIDLEEQRALIEARLPKVSHKTFEDYCIILKLLGILYQEVPKQRPCKWR